MPVALLGGWELSLKHRLFHHFRRYLDFYSFFSRTVCTIWRLKFHPLILQRATQCVCLFDQRWTLCRPVTLRALTRTRGYVFEKVLLEFFSVERYFCMHALLIFVITMARFFFLQKLQKFTLKIFQILAKTFVLYHVVSSCIMCKTLFLVCVSLKCVNFQGERALSSAQICS